MKKMGHILQECHQNFEEGAQIQWPMKRDKPTADIRASGVPTLTLRIRIMIFFFNLDLWRDNFLIQKVQEIHGSRIYRIVLPLIRVPRILDISRPLRRFQSKVASSVRPSVEMSKKRRGQWAIVLFVIREVPSGIFARRCASLILRDAVRLRGPRISERTCNPRWHVTSP